MSGRSRLARAGRRALGDPGLRLLLLALLATAAAACGGGDGGGGGAGY